MKDEVRDQLGQVDKRRVSHFIVAAWPARVEVYVDDDGLTLATGAAEPPGEVPTDVLDRLTDVDGWKGDVTVSVAQPYSHDEVAELIHRVLYEGWLASPAAWAFVGEDGYDEALAHRPRGRIRRGPRRMQR